MRKIRLLLVGANSNESPLLLLIVICMTFLFIFVKVFVCDHEHTLLYIVLMFLSMYSMYGNVRRLHHLLVIIVGGRVFTSGNFYEH